MAVTPFQGLLGGVSVLVSGRATGFSATGRDESAGESASNDEERDDQLERSAANTLR